MRIGKAYISIVFFCVVAYFFSDKINAAFQESVKFAEGYHAIDKKKWHVAKSTYKLTKTKLRVRYKASEIQFHIDFAIYHAEVVFSYIEKVLLSTTFFLHGEYKLFKKLRGPPNLLF